MSHPFPLQPGTVLRDRYVLREIVHSGHWSLTLRAQRQGDGQTVILKLPGPGNSTSGVSIAFHAAWMQRVFHSLSQLHHPNRASVLDYIEAHGLPILVQQEVLGIPLSQQMVHRPVPEGEAIALIRKIGIALSGVHGKGLIHRDVRPENIIYRSGVKQPVLIDWGLQPSVFPANRASSYAAPEQFQPGGQFQPCIDIYSLAATLYALVTGQPPLHASLRQQSALELPRRLQPQLSTSLERAILCGMELNPQARPPSVGAWLGLLPEVSAVEPVPAEFVPSVGVAMHGAVGSPSASPRPEAVATAQPTAQPISARVESPSTASTRLKTPVPTRTAVTQTAARQTIDLAKVQPASTPPMKTLLTLCCAATLFGTSVGLVLRITNPASVAGISALGRSQSFPAAEWPDAGQFESFPSEVPPPEGSFDRWGGENSLVEPGRDNGRQPIREFLPPESSDPPISKPLPRSGEDVDEIEPRRDRGENPRSSPSATETDESGRYYQPPGYDPSAEASGEAEPLGDSESYPSYEAPPAGQSFGEQGVEESLEEPLYYNEGAPLGEEPLYPEPLDEEPFYETPLEDSLTTNGPAESFETE